MAAQSSSPEHDPANSHGEPSKPAAPNLAETASFSSASAARQTHDFVMGPPVAPPEMPLQAPPPVALPETFGRYRILSRLGYGGMGAVFLARDSQLDRTVALKVPRISTDSTGTMVDRFLREARAAAVLNHPNICPIFDVGEIDGIHFIAMGYIEGRPLTDYIATGRPQPEVSVAMTVRKIALALDEAHGRGIVHRDLKPANIMIDRRREPIVMDFGLAFRVDERSSARITKDGILVGTPAYMSPEQIDGRALIGPLSDIYSLGVVMYELLTCRCPFEGNMVSIIGQVLHSEPPSVSQFRPDISPALDAICLKAMAKGTSQRFASMKDLAHALLEFLKGDLSADPLSAPRPASPALLPAAGTATVAGAASTAAAETFDTLLAETLPTGPNVLPLAGIPSRAAMSRLDARRAQRRRKRALAAGGAFLGLLVVGLMASLFTPDPKKEPPPDVPKTIGALPPSAPPRTSVPQYADDVPLHPPKIPGANVPATQEAPATEKQDIPSPGPSIPAVERATPITDTAATLKTGAASDSPAAPPTNTETELKATDATTTPKAGAAASSLPSPDPSLIPAGPQAALTKEALKEQFRITDRNGDGKLDATELGWHVILRADRNHDRRLTLSELERAYDDRGAKLFDPPTEEELKKPARLLPPPRGGPLGPKPPGGPPPGPPRPR